MDLKKLLGINVQKYRRLRNIKQEKLAELTHLDPTTISSIERGKQFVSAENLLAIAKALDVEVACLFDLENSKTNDETYNEILEFLSYFKEDRVRLNAIKNFLKGLI